MAQIAVIPGDVQSTLKKFRSSSPALVCYIDRKTNPPVVKTETDLFDEDEDFSIEALASRLPDAPRYVVLAYKPPSESFPRVIMIDWIPNGCEPASSMLHVGTLPVIEKLIRPHKVIQITEGEDGLTEEVLDAKLRR